jgi:hypothetical protein
MSALKLDLLLLVSVPLTVTKPPVSRVAELMVTVMPPSPLIWASVAVGAGVGDDESWVELPVPLVLLDFVALDWLFVPLPLFPPHPDTIKAALATSAIATAALRPLTVGWMPMRPRSFTR